MAMAQNEFDANLKVQALKPQVNDAGKLDAISVQNKTDGELATLTAAVTSSIKYRSILNSLGSDAGHLQRIAIEQGYLGILNTETVNRAKKKKEASGAAEAKKLASAPSLLPAGASWGTKK